jgi:hypothetical protein
VIRHVYLKPQPTSIALVAFTGEQPPGYQGAEVPSGWVVQGGNRFALVIAPKGDPYPHRVTLHLVNRGIGKCHAEAVVVIRVSVTLPSPLGTRRLVQALNGEPIKYHVGHF